MKQSDLKKNNIPDAPGVYFWKQGEKIIYIGRATSLRERVKSYFSKDLIATRGLFLIDMVASATTVEVIQADSVLEAIILEANLIKKWKPRYNTKEKDDRSFNYVIITEEDFPRVLLVRGKDLEERFPRNELKYVFGPYPHGGFLKDGMKIIRKIFPFRDRCAPTSFSLDGILKTGKPCFNQQIGLCPGVCTGEISKKEYGKTIQNLRIFFEGKKSLLIKKLKAQMKNYARERAFEKASEVKKTLFALTHIQDISLLKPESRAYPWQGPSLTKEEQIEKAIFRMEAYDVAHMSGKNRGGVMVVLEDNHLKKSDYRLFKIQAQNGADDTAALKEILNRRLNHGEWPFPSIIAVDGGVAQKRVAEETLRARGFILAVVAVVKNEKHRPESILGDEHLVKKYKKEILLLNSEAHRFAIKYHRKMRSRSFLGN